MKIYIQTGLRRAIMSMKADELEDFVIENLPILEALAILQDIGSKRGIKKTERKNIILSYLKKDKAFIERLCDVITEQVPDETYGYDMYKLAKRVERLGRV